MLALATDAEDDLFAENRIGGVSTFGGHLVGAATWSTPESVWGFSISFEESASDSSFSLKPVAELDGAGNVVSRFVYGSKGQVPDYIVKGGVTYRVVSDHLGSPRLIVDQATGTVAERIDFDEWGVVSGDSNPGFQPFGFDGGLFDGATGLVRFGARDYQASAGRWLRKEPERFRASVNFYSFCFDDPLSYIDLDGRAPQWVHFLSDAAAGFGDSLTGGFGLAHALGLPSLTEYVRDIWGGGIVRCDSAGYLTGEIGAGIWTAVAGSAVAAEYLPQAIDGALESWQRSLAQAEWRAAADGIEALEESPIIQGGGTGTGVPTGNLTQILPANLPPE